MSKTKNRVRQTYEDFLAKACDAGHITPKELIESLNYFDEIKHASHRPPDIPSVKQRKNEAKIALGQRIHAALAGGLTFERFLTQHTGNESERYLKDCLRLYRDHKNK